MASSICRAQEGGATAHQPLEDINLDAKIMLDINLDAKIMLDINYMLRPSLP